MASHKPIPFSKPTITRKDLEQVLECMVTEQINHGKLSERFSKMIGEIIENKNTFTLNSASAALVLILKTLNLKENDEVIMSAYAEPFILDAILFFNARPVLIDISENSWHMNQEAALKAITERTKAVIFSHLFGMPASLENFKTALEEKNSQIRLIEDCCHALGSKLNGKPCGLTGDYAVFSFEVSSVITTANGGALSVNRRKYLKQLKRCAEPGTSENAEPAFDAGLTDMQAAMGISELSFYQKFLNKRREIGRIYQENADRSKNRFFSPPENVEYNFFAFPLIISSSLKIAREFFKKYEIEARRPFEKPLYEYLGETDENFPVLRKYHMKTLLPPLYPSLTKEQIERIASLIKNIR